MAALAAAALFGLARARAVAHGSDRRWLFVLLVSAGGLYSTVPETDRALGLLGALTGSALALLVLPRLRRAIWAPAIGALLAYIAVEDGWERPSAAVAAVAVVVLALVEPTARELLRRTGAIVASSTGRIRIALLVAVHVAAVLVVARVAGLRDSAPEAGAIALATILLVGLLNMAILVKDAPRD